MAEEVERITVSRETLRAELSAMELRIVDRLTNALELKADAKLVDQLDLRVQSLELSRAAREEMPGQVIDLAKRVSALERFRYAVPSVSLLSCLAAIGTLAYYLTAHP